jgi:anaerobic magnesium-protoporphyrin IX monomethyl ester cyclase
MRVLFFNPANYLEIGIPQGIAILSAVLKREGHNVELFDTTFLKPNKYVPDSDHAMAGPAIYKKTPYTLEDLVKDDPTVDIVEEFQKKIDIYSPDLIAVSTMTTNHDYAIKILRKLKKQCPVVFGGVHSTICPDDVIRESVVDIICIGEGENVLLELCNSLEKGNGYNNLKNLWVKSKNGTIYKNRVRSFVDLDSLPCPDWSIFDSRHLYRPFMGKIYKGGFYISSRGCPGGCTYCVNRTLRNIFKDCGPYFRYQKPETTITHLTELKERYNATWFKFGDDTFLLQPLDNLEELREGLKPLKINFGCSVRPDTVLEEKVKLAKEMGCVAMSIGIESGNEEIRIKVLNRNISNLQIENAFKLINDYKIRISSFNLIGLPGETRENVFETIEFNIKLNVKSGNVYVLYPFPGSQISIRHNVEYKKKNGEIIPMSKASGFSLSRMTPKEVEGLKKTFNLYLTLPKELWPIIKLAESNGSLSNKIYQALTEFSSTVV